MNKSVFVEYATLSQEIVDLQEKQKELKASCLSEMLVSKIDTVKSEMGTFSTVESKSWIYTPKIAKKEKEIKKQYEEVLVPLEKELKELKTEEQNSGKATCEVSTSMRFTATKLDLTQPH